MVKYSFGNSYIKVFFAKPSIASVAQQVERQAVNL